MDVLWLLLSLTLSPDAQVRHDLTGEIAVTYHRSLNECTKTAVASEQRLEKRLRSSGIKDEYDDLIRKTGLLNMAVCWNGKEAKIVYPRTVDGPWIAVVSRFTPISYVEKSSGASEKVGVGIARAGRFKSRADCQQGLGNAVGELRRSLKAKEEHAAFCLQTNAGGV